MAIQLLEIEKELSGPDREATLLRHDTVLKAMDERLGDAMSAGMPPQEYARAESLRHAVTLARKVLRLAVRDE